MAMNWIHLAQDRDKFPPLHGNEPSGSIKMRGISWPGEELLASQDWLCPMELDNLTCHRIYT